MDAKSINAPRVSIDVRMINHSGIGTYVRNVVPRIVRLLPEWRYTLLAARNAPIPGEWTSLASMDVVQCSSDIYSVAEQLELPFRQSPASDVFWSPHYNAPLLARGKLVVTVHDVGHLALADLYGGALRQTYARSMFAGVRRRASRIIFVSNFSRSEFEHYVGVPPRGSTVIRNGVDASWFAIPSGKSPHPRPYLLFIGSVKPHKNLGGVLRALETAGDAYRGDLVVVGDRVDQRTIDRNSLALAAQLGERVHFAGRIDDAALRAYVAHAEALVMPSLYEGFGLPPLEAMAAGCPCIVSTRGGLPETCGDAALYCDAADPANIARQIVRMTTEPGLREEYVRRGRGQARGFSWDTCAVETAALLRSLARSA
ncbi:MAG: glycosyltransferase family 1 protein [bacterium]